MGRIRTREFKESKIWGGIKDSRRLEGGGEEAPGGVLDITCTTLRSSSFKCTLACYQRKIVYTFTFWKYKTFLFFSICI